MQIDFIQLCRDYNIKYTLLVDDWVNIECPICRHSGTRGFKGGLNISGGYFHCWSCGGHRLDTVLTELLGIEFHEVDNIIEKYSGQVSIRKKLNKPLQNKVGKIELPMDYLSNRGKEYLIKRHFDPEYIEQKYKVTGPTVAGFWAGRLIIPIYYNNRIVSFQGRSILSKEACTRLNILRYMTLSKEESIIDPKTILYNLDNCKSDYLILVEGAFDCWRFGDNCAATLGTSTTPKQHILLATLFKTIYILFDPEKEAQERANKLANQLVVLRKINVEIINTELDHDPGDMTEKEIYNLKKELGI
jgi:DNA primase